MWFHHSPKQFTSVSVSNQLQTVHQIQFQYAASDSSTEQQDILLVGLGEGVPLAVEAGLDDDGALHGGAERGALLVPPERACFLPGRLCRRSAGLDGSGTASPSPARPPTATRAGKYRAYVGTRCNLQVRTNSSRAIEYILVPIERVLVPF